MKPFFITLWTNFGMLSFSTLTTVFVIKFGGLEAFFMQNSKIGSEINFSLFLVPKFHFLNFFLISQNCEIPKCEILVREASLKFISDSIFYFACHFHGFPKCFEYGFNFVVVIFSIWQFYVNICH